MDDDRHFCSMLTLVLEQQHEVVVAHNGKQGLQLLEENDIDLVLVDLNMPETNGIEVILKIRSQDKKLPIIAISGEGRYPVKANLQSAELLGANAVLEKPFKTERLLATIQSCLQDDQTD